MKNIAFAWIVCVLGLVGLFAWIGNDMLASGPARHMAGGLVHADFTLQTGGKKGAVKTVTSKELRGKYLLVYFGFTHCPDICPTTLLLMNNAINQMGDKAGKIQPVFISVDPQRDTPSVAAEYASHFGKNFLGLSGSPEQIKHAADAFKVYYSKVEDKGSALGYMVDHSGFIYLMGPDGNYLAHFEHHASEQELKQGLMEYVR